MAAIRDSDVNALTIRRGAPLDASERTAFAWPNRCAPKDGAVIGIECPKKERDRVQHQLSGLNAALAAFARVYRDSAGTKPRRKISAKGRARIAAAQRARWARVNGQQKVVPIAKPKRTVSASARRKIAAAQRARWAKVKREKKAA